MARYTSTSSWPDVIPKEVSLSQLPLLNALLSISPPTEMIRSSERTEYIVQTLGLIMGSLLPIGFSQFFSQTLFPCGSRKAALKPQVSSLIDGFISRRFAPDVVAHLKSQVQINAKEAKKAIKGLGGDKDTLGVCLMRFSTLVGINNATFLDLTNGMPSNVAWSRQTADAKVGEWTRHSQVVGQCESHSVTVLRDMVSPIMAGEGEVVVPRGARSP
jgi:hypothetical protein